MNAQNVTPMKTTLLAAGAMLAMVALAPYAQATTVHISFSGTNASGSANLTLATDPNADPNYNPSTLNPSQSFGTTDPQGAQYITGADGTFSDSTLHLSDVPITGVLATSPGLPPLLKPSKTNYESLPQSFSWLGTGKTKSSYDNLFYANGSPVVCPPVTSSSPHGGFLDIFGVMFSLDFGNNQTGYLDLWSDGGVSGVDPTYGFKFIAPTDGGVFTADEQFSGVTASVPAPHFVWLFGAGLLGLFAWRRVTEKKRAEETD